jgi:hypothetical protein
MVDQADDVVVNSKAERIDSGREATDDLDLILQELSGGAVGRD